MQPFEHAQTALPKQSAACVLIIDDEFTSRMILERVIKYIESDTTVVAFADPVEAMVWINKNLPDLVLVDFMMDKMSGLQVIENIRQIPHLEDVPIVVVTATEDRNVRYQVLDAGATDFITKPIDAYECRVRCRNLWII